MRYFQASRTGTSVLEQGHGAEWLERRSRQVEARMLLSFRRRRVGRGESLSPVFASPLLGDKAPLTAPVLHDDGTRLSFTHTKVFNHVHYGGNVPRYLMPHGDSESDASRLDREQYRSLCQYYTGECVGYRDPSQLIDPEKHGIRVHLAMVTPAKMPEHADAQAARALGLRKDWSPSESRLDIRRARHQRRRGARAQQVSAPSSCGEG